MASATVGPNGGQVGPGGGLVGPQAAATTKFRKTLSALGTGVGKRQVQGS